ncbi:hypothetical protein P8C59_006148 [Phyllachora maydis]|uniref:ubiquitinyl hydrolase 1 n=1 Tax=Phyllachora maydis TaxID=1825666 RepID=A0AAD9ME92_9PEZI|nr:hypothetical protein P8C59_006148 [Phyllachora maydis]
MNSDARRIASQSQFHVPFNKNPELYESYQPAAHPGISGLWDRLNGSTLVSVLLIILALVYQSWSRIPQLPPLPDVLWDAVVYLIPSALLDVVDRRLNPPLFPRPPPPPQSMLQSQRRSHGAKTLAALKPLPAYLASVGLGAKQMDNGRAASRTTDSLRDLIAELSDTANNGKTLWTPDVLKNMSTWQQQDAQEYYSKLLDEVDKEVASAMRAAHKPTGFQTAVAVATAADCASASGKDDSAASQHSDDSGYHSLSTSAHAGSGPGLGASEMKMLKNPLEGLTAQRVACAVCGFSEGLSMIPFNCLTLNLGMDAEYDLYERLDHCTKVEFIQGVECAKCTLLKFRDMLRTIIDRSRQAGRKDEEFPDFFIRLAATEAALEEADFSAETTTKICKVPSSCRVDSTKTKQGVIARPPRSLVIHMNRSVFDEKTGHMFKNLAAVRFPRTLDLGPWCLGSAEGRTGEIDEQDGAAGMLSLHSEQASSSTADTAEQWLLDPAASMIAGDLRPSKFTGPLYELRAEASKGVKAADSHTDGDGGNTTTQGVREEPEGDGEDESAQWWRLSDQDVTLVDEETVLSQGGVFMLFYDCVDSSFALTTDCDRDPFAGSSEIQAKAARQDDSQRTTLQTSRW